MICFTSFMLSVFANFSFEKIFLKNLCSLKKKSAKEIVSLSQSCNFGLILRKKCTSTTTILRPISWILNSIFLFTSLLKSKLFDLNFLLNHFSKQSVVNLSENAILLFLAATVSVQSLNCNSVYL